MAVKWRDLTWPRERAYYKTRNTGTRNTGGTPEHPDISGTTRNTNGTSAEHPGTTGPYKTKNNCSVF